MEIAPEPSEPRLVSMGCSPSGQGGFTEGSGALGNGGLTTVLMEQPVAPDRH